MRDQDSKAQSPGISRIPRISWKVNDPNCSDVLSEVAESSKMREQLHEKFCREHKNCREFPQQETELGKVSKKCSGNGSFLRIPGAEGARNGQRV